MAVEERNRCGESLHTEHVRFGEEKQRNGQVGDSQLKEPGYGEAAENGGLKAEN